MLTILREWNRNDPPTSFERERNKKIEKLQKTRNKFIDRPRLADGLRCKVP